MNKAAPILQTSDLSIGYKKNTKHEKVLAGPLQMEILPGQLISLLGPNGAGKSTLLRTLAGLQAALQGSVAIMGVPITSMKPIEKAKNISVVLIGNNRPTNVSVYSIISLGRYPYTGWLGKLSENDKNIIKRSIQATGVEQYLKRKIDELSDGEAQKVMIARALAQDTPLIILDEPTAHLDLPNRIELMQMLHKLSIEANKGILVSTHDLDLALQVSDKIWILRSDGKFITGVTEDMVLNGTFETAFEKESFEFNRASGTFNIHQTRGENIKVVGDGAAAFWTKRALLRHQFSVNNDSPAHCTIRIIEEENKTVWRIEKDNNSEEHHSIESLIDSSILKSNC